MYLTYKEFPFRDQTNRIQSLVCWASGDIAKQLDGMNSLELSDMIVDNLKFPQKTLIETINEQEQELNWRQCWYPVCLKTELLIRVPSN